MMLNPLTQFLCHNLASYSFEDTTYGSKLSNKKMLPEKNIHCEVCGQSFKLEKYYNIHMAKGHGKSFIYLYICQILLVLFNR